MVGLKDLLKVGWMGDGRAGLWGCLMVEWKEKRWVAPRDLSWAVSMGCYWDTTQAVHLAVSWVMQKVALKVAPAAASWVGWKANLKAGS